MIETIGKSVPYYPPDGYQKALDFLIKDARKALPIGTFFEIRKSPPRLDYITNRTIISLAWYSTSLMTKEEPEAGYNKEGGFYHIGTFKVEKED